MKIPNLKIITASLVASAFLLGCGSDSNSTPIVPIDTSISGQLVDNYVQNADYLCGDGKSDVTDINGRFNCETFPVEFRLGGLRLGIINTLPDDLQVFPQDLLGVQRGDTQNVEVVAMARFLQSCDEDNNTENGLQIRQAIKDSLIVDENFTSQNIDSYVEISVDEIEAIIHLEQTTEFIDAVNAASAVPAQVKEALLTNNSVLTQELKNTLSYMGNEERLAYDVYNKLFEYFPSVTQFNNIATNGEYPHIPTVQLLIKKYISDYSEFSNIDLEELAYKDTAIENMDAGTYDISALQNLYDWLMEKGIASQQDALEVGCLIEVTDINDLDHDIGIAQDQNATDIEAAFDFLRVGSYAHYWAFDSGLKAMGVTDGCCVLGTIDGVNYCHPEYPQNENGSDNAGGQGDGNGEGKQHGKQ